MNRARKDNFYVGYDSFRWAALYAIAIYHHIPRLLSDKTCDKMNIQLFICFEIIKAVHS